MIKIKIKIIKMNLMNRVKILNIFQKVIPFLYIILYMNKSHMITAMMLSLLLKLDKIPPNIIKVIMNINNFQLYKCQEIRFFMFQSYYN